MNESTKTKKALRGSLFALFLCIVLLIGTTFAWFTDTASTGVNKIQSGNLKMDVKYTLDGKEWNDLDGATNLFQKGLWEPGHVEYAVLKVENVGSLALKYKMGINIASETGSTNVNGEDFKLSDYIKFAVVDGDQSKLDRNALVAAAGAGQLINAGYSGEGTLNENGNNDIVTLVVWMPETVGNEANHAANAEAPEINLGINVVATQAAHESDSFGNTYDANAAYPAIVSDIKAKYGSDGLKMPSGVEIKDNGNGSTDSFTITLKDKEAFLYFTQVFDRAAAFDARKAGLDAGTITKYPSEYNHSSLNMWYGPYCSRITVKMDCDVDLNGINVKPFGFNGYESNFDGNGHTIKNAKIQAASGDAGFFQPRMNVSNVVLDNIQVTATGCGSAGVVAGSPNSNISGVTVKNCSVKGAKYTGAIAGYDYGDITNCIVKNTVVSGQYKVGGIVGYVCTDNAAQQRIITGNKLTNVTVKGDNLWNGKNSFVIGKIVGNWNAQNGTCNNNTFTGTTSATNNIGEIESGCNVVQK